MPADARAQAALDRPSAASRARARRADGADRKGSPGRGAAGGRRRCAVQFQDLCASPRGDRLSRPRGGISYRHPRGIPLMDFERRNEAKRFIMLIDTLYDAHVKLLASAEAEGRALPGGGAAGKPSSSTAPCRGSSRCGRRNICPCRTAGPIRPDPAGGRASSRHEAASRRAGAAPHANLRDRRCAPSRDRGRPLRSARAQARHGGRIAEAAGMTHANVYRYSPRRGR